MKHASGRLLSFFSVALAVALIAFAFGPLSHALRFHSAPIVAVDPSAPDSTITLPSKEPAAETGRPSAPPSGPSGQRGADRGNRGSTTAPQRGDAGTGADGGSSAGATRPGSSSRDTQTRRPSATTPGSQKRAPNRGRTTPSTGPRPSRTDSGSPTTGSSSTPGDASTGDQPAAPSSPSAAPLRLTLASMARVPARTSGSPDHLALTFTTAADQTSTIPPELTMNVALPDAPAASSGDALHLQVAMLGTPPKDPSQLDAADLTLRVRMAYSDADVGSPTFSHDDPTAGALSDTLHVWVPLTAAQCGPGTAKASPTGSERLQDGTAPAAGDGTGAARDQTSPVDASIPVSDILATAPSSDTVQLPDASATAAHPPAALTVKVQAAGSVSAGAADTAPSATSTTPAQPQADATTTTPASGTPTTTAPASAC